MSYAIERVAQELSADLKKYDIRVDGPSRAIIHADGVLVVDPYTDARKCRKILKESIKKAKAKADAKAQANQGSLL